MQAEHERLAVIHVFITAIPVLRCVASTDSVISDFADNKSGTLVKHSLFEFGNLPAVNASRVNPSYGEFSLSFREVRYYFLDLVVVNY